MITIIIKVIASYQIRGEVVFLLPKIKYCCRNFKHGSQDTYKLIQHEFPEVKQKKKDCLGNCKMCSKQCFVMVGKKKQILCAMTADELYKELKILIG